MDAQKGAKRVEKGEYKRRIAGVQWIKSWGEEGGYNETVDGLW